MKLFQKLLLTFALVIILLAITIPNTVKAELTDAQRQALVNVARTIVEEGNKKRILRYSQDHRINGFNWTKVSNHNKQATVGTITMHPHELGRITMALRKSTGNKHAVSKTTEYSCKILGADINDTISFDCSSLCSAVYNMTFGTSFGSWPWVSSQFGSGSSLFNVSSNMSSVEPGDILWKEGHVAIFLGDIDGDGQDEIAEASGFCSYKNTNSTLSSKLADFLCSHPTYIAEHPQRKLSKSFQPTIQLPEELIRDASKQVAINHYKEGRFKKVAKYKGPIGDGRAINLADITTSNTGGALTVESVNNEAVILPWGTAYQKFWPEGLDIADETLKNSEGYFHKGIPAYGAYIGRVEPYNWFINLPQDVFNWVISSINMVFQSQIVGWANIAENIISNILRFGIEPNEPPTQVGSIEGITKINVSTGTTVMANANKPYDDGILSKNAEDKVTIEDILYNRVPIFDVNFFNFSKAGGQDLSSSSLIYILRQNIAGWYYTLRNIAVAGMLIALLYIAIKTIISVPEEKAEYKQKLKDWIIAFIILFLIHYFMIAVVNLNNTFVEMLNPETLIGSSEESVFENIRIMAYDFSPITGLTGAILFAAMIFYLVRFAILYTKRLLILAILTIVSPLVAVRCAFNKKQSDLKKWAKEYTFNIFIQLLHAILYTVFASIAFELAKTATIRGTIFSMITLGLLFTAEKIMKKVLKFNVSESIGGLENSTLGQLAMMQGISTMGKLAGQVAKSGTTRNVIKTSTQKGSETIKKVSHLANNTYEKTKSYLATTIPEDLKNNKLLEAIKSTQKHGKIIIADYQQGYKDEMNENYYKTFSSINKKIQRLKEQEKEARKAYATQGVKFVTNAILGTGASLALFPVLVVNPKAAQYMGLMGMTHLLGAYGKRNISRPRKNDAQNSKKYTSPKLRFAWATASTMGNIATLGAVSGIKNAKEGFEDMAAQINEDYPKQLHMLEEARALEDKILTQLGEIYGTSDTSFSITATKQNAKTELNAMATRDMIDKAEKDREEYQRTTNDKQVEDSKLRQQVQRINSRDFDQALSATLDDVTSKDIQDGIVEYMIENDITKIEENDIEQVKEKINDVLKRNKRGVSLSVQFSDNLRNELRRKVTDSGMTDYDDSRPINIRKPETGNKKENTEENEQTYTKENIHFSNQSEKIREQLESKKEKISSQDITNAVSDYLLTIDTSDEQRVDTSIAVDKIREALKRKNDELLISTTLENDIKKELENKVQERKKQDEIIEDIVPKMQIDDLVDLFASALGKENSVDRTIRQKNLTSLMKDVKKLDSINREYQETNQEPIYKDVKSIIKGLKNSLGTT